MPRRQAPLQVNTFSSGLKTEFSPLSIPPNVSIDELNMEIDSKGNRFRRLGFNFEDDYVEVDSGVALDGSKNLAASQFRWENVDNDPEKYLLVVQVGNYLGIHDPDDVTSTSNGLIYSETFDSSSYENRFSFASVDEFLIVANGLKEILVYTYNGSTITKTEETLLIRDLFGVEKTGYTEQLNLAKRPSSSSSEHIYNLRNRTFYSPRKINNDEVLKDPIKAFYDDHLATHGVGKYPSNADDLNYYLYSDSGDAGDRLIERFFSTHMVKSAPSVGESSIGHFIIDALERGSSREAREAELRSNYPELTFSVSSLPVDVTPGGATVVETFAGRIWYGGFSGEVNGGDLKSPRMSNYLLFSSLVKDRTDITQCYQRADPTSNEDSALVDTDGGFIKLSGAYGINNFTNLDGSLFVFAANGIWRLSGSESSFTATSYQADKLSNEGCISGNSVVVVGDTIFYWGFKGIHVIQRNEYGFWKVNDITEETIQTFYNEIDENLKRVVVGDYDKFEKKIRWVYSYASNSTLESNELVFDIAFKAFVPLSVPTDNGGLPLVVGISEGQPYTTNSSETTVTAMGVVVTADSVEVTSTITRRGDGLKTSIYLVLTNYYPTIKYTFGFYKDTSFYDWGNTNYDAYLVSGALTGGEARYKKQAPYLSLFFKKTETGFDSELNLINPSSCLLSSQWNWTNSVNGKKWSNAREAYRLKQPYFPEDFTDEYDDGVTIISTRNKIRGMGHSVSFKLQSQPGMNMYIHGWFFDLVTNVKE